MPVMTTVTPCTLRSVRFRIFCLAAACALVAGAAHAQSLAPVPPGYVLQDDMLIPESALLIDNWCGDPWPNGVVPYFFDPNSNISAANQARVITAMAEWEAVAAVDFVPCSGQSDCLRIFSWTGGYHFATVGHQDPPQNANVVYLDFTSNGGAGPAKYTIAHELGHVLGFKHEQSRPDRNLYVQINAGNITPGFENNFDISNCPTQGLPYDFLSIMHYSATAFSVNGQPTITALVPFNGCGGVTMGNRTFLSVLDAQGMALAYGAPPPPAITSLTPDSAPAGINGFTLTVNGTGFLEGSPSGCGVRGSRIVWSGLPLPTTYVSPTRLTAAIDPILLGNVFCAGLRVENPAPGGGLSANVPFPIFSAAAAPDAWTGQESGDLFGFAVAGPGDLDGDGQDDVAAGAPGFNGGRGMVRAYSGRTGAALWMVEGAAAGYRLGSALAAAGDIDGDGVGDVVASAPGYASDRGYVRVYSGANGGLIRSIYGASAGDRFGAAVAGAGLIDADAVPDVIVGIPGISNGAGRVEARSGASGALIHGFDGPAAGDALGTSVGGGHDLNGDGVPDLFAGAPGNDSNGDGAGMARAWSGANGATFFTRYGDGALDGFGRSVAVIASTDGDARGEAVAGAPERGNPQGGEGPGYVRVFGVSGAAWATKFTAAGVAARDAFGCAVAAAGDVNQDGFMDVAVGADQDPAIPVVGGAGYVRILSGRDGSVLQSVSGAAAGDALGYAVAAAGDTDADGTPDVITGAPLDDAPCANTGSSRVIHPRVAPEQRKVMITEVSWGDPDGLEITNFGAASVSLAGWRVHWKDGATSISDAFGISIAPGESIVVRETSALAIAELPAGTQVLQPFPQGLTTVTGPIAVALVNPAGLVVDEVRISATNGSFNLTGLGGGFRGLAVRGNVSGTGGANGVERIWGLDSNSGGDWTEQPDRSFGLENRSSGPRGTDPLPVPAVVINETDDSPDLIELRNTGGVPVDLEGWFLRCSAGQGMAHAVLRPWSAPAVVAAGAYAVAGEGAAPAELPAGVDYVDLIAVGLNIPWTTEEYDAALYDHRGRLVDLFRTKGHDDLLVHNHPRAPAHWSDFTGTAGRGPNGERAVGRDAASTDTGSGLDFRPLLARTMGSANGAGASNGLGDALDVRLNETGRGDGLAIIINAGAAYSGHKWSFLLTAGHLGGQGPFFGLGAEALQNWLVFSVSPPWFGFLDARGSARVDLAPGTLPAGVGLDTLFILQDPGGALSAQTRVLAFDT